MPRPASSPDAVPPDWVGLMDVARARAGFFTAQEALSHHVSPQVLRYRVASGWLLHEMRGVYRFASASPTEHDELIALWLWTGEEGVYSHQTALALHQLSDALPARVHLTVPSSWRYGRFVAPKHVVLAVADLPAADVAWFGAVRVTTVARTIADCIAAHVSPSLIEQALAQARRRGQLTTAEHTRLRRAFRGQTA